MLSIPCTNVCVPRGALKSPSYLIVSIVYLFSCVVQSDFFAINTALFRPPPGSPENFFYRIRLGMAPGPCPGGGRFSCERATECRYDNFVLLAHSLPC